MADNEEKKVIGGGEKEVGSENKRVDMVLSITFKADGGLQVSAPGNGQMFDEPMCLWMLDKAKDFIKAKNAKAIQSNLMIPKHLARS